MHLIPFSFEHLELFDWREEERGRYDTGSEFTRRLCLAAEDPEVFRAHTLVHDGRILVVGGVFKVSEKTGRAWTIFSRHAGVMPLSAARRVRREFKEIVAALGLHRVETLNLADRAAHHKWCEWLGFVFEGRAPKYDDAGRDYARYGLVL